MKQHFWINKRKGVNDLRTWEVKNNHKKYIKSKILREEPTEKTNHNLYNKKLKWKTISLELMKSNSAV